MSSLRAGDDEVLAPHMFLYQAPKVLTHHRDSGRYRRKCCHPRERECNPIPILRLPPTGPKIRGRARAPFGVSGRVSDPAAGKLVLKVPISKPEDFGRRLDYIPESGDPALDPLFRGDDGRVKVSPLSGEGT